MVIHLYHYTDSESLVKIVKQKLLQATEGSVLDPDEDESVFFTQKVIRIELGMEYRKIRQKSKLTQAKNCNKGNKYHEKKLCVMRFLISL